MATETKLYGVTDAPDRHIEDGYHRLGLVTDDRTGEASYRLERADGSSYLCDADGELRDDDGQWTLRRVLADIPASPRAADRDAFFAALRAAVEALEPVRSVGS